MLIGDASHKPILRTLGFTGHGNIVSRLRFKELTVVPVYCYVLDELESIHMGFIILRQIGSHLQWAVEGDG